MRWQRGKHAGDGQPRRRLALHDGFGGQSAEALRTKMDALRGEFAGIPCDSLRQRLEETVLKVPALSAKLADAQAEHKLLQSLAALSDGNHLQ